MIVIDGHLRTAGDEQITDLSAVDTLTVPTGACLALIQAEANDVRFRCGADPSASVGMLLFAGDYMIYNGELSELRFIQVGTGAKLNVQYFKK